MTGMVVRAIVTDPNAPAPDDHSPFMGEHCQCDQCTNSMPPLDVFDFELGKGAAVLQLYARTRFVKALQAGHVISFQRAKGLK